MSTRLEENKVFAKNKEVSFVLDRSGDKSLSRDESCHPLHSSDLVFEKLTENGKESIESGEIFLSKLRSKETFHKAKSKTLRAHPFTKGSSSLLWSKSNSSQNRYHVEEDSRFSALKPGIISESLRTALGLRQNQLPLYIYRMRNLGYPPGHLADARCQQSGILVFTKDGCEVTTDGTILEEGEVNEKEEQDVYDVDQLISFPGFNVAPPNGTIDESEQLDMPFMKAEHSKEAMTKTLTCFKVFMENRLKVKINNHQQKRQKNSLNCLTLIKLSMNQSCFRNKQQPDGCQKWV